MVLPGMFTVDGFCELIQTEKVTSTAVVPTILAMIIEFEDLKKYDLSSLQTLSVGGGALPLGLKKKAEKIDPRLLRHLRVRHDRDRSRGDHRLLQEVHGRLVAGAAR